MVEIELVSLAVLDRTLKDTPSETGSYYERLVLLSFLDFERDEDFLNVCTNEDRHFVPLCLREGNLTSVWPQVLFCTYCEVLERNGEVLHSPSVAHSNLSEALVINWRNREFHL